MKDMDKSFKKDTETEFPLREEMRPHQVTAPDGQVIDIDPLQDYFCQEPPKVHAKSYFKIVEDFYNWARAHSLWILGFGTGCGAIEMRPLMTPRFDAYRYGIQWRPTPRQANLLVISGYLSVKTLKRAIRAYEQMPAPKYVVGLGSCT
ncbi:MAG: NADH-quinone oxidoreductase subunit NuoB, partial [Maritimibacter sp.]|nr:NADH-quinone oxidoreductase subunit NuoB [Maritimibacter sp.]